MGNLAPTGGKISEKPEYLNPYRGWGGGVSGSVTRVNRALGGVKGGAKILLPKPSEQTLRSYGQKPKSTKTKTRKLTIPSPVMGCARSHRGYGGRKISLPDAPEQYPPSYGRKNTNRPRSPRSRVNTTEKRLTSVDRTATSVRGTTTAGS